MHTEEELDAFAAWERSAWEQRATPYAASLGDLTRGSIPALLDAATIGPGTRVLDVGTGPGFVALAAQDRGASVRAVDQSTEMVRLARAAGVDAVRAGVETLPFSDDSFDAVVAGYLLNHLPRPETAVAELVRVLIPGGRVALTVWDDRTENLATGLLSPIVTDLGLTEVVPPGPDAQRFADETELRRLLAGWDDIVIEHLRWSVRVEPGRWFDALADATPRTGAVLAQAGEGRRAQARERYVSIAVRDFGTADGLVELPAAAVLASAARAGRPPFDHGPQPEHE